MAGVVTDIVWVYALARQELGAPRDAAYCTLTIRARVASDLDNLRAGVLPSLDATQAGAGTDYRFRATVPKEDVARALGELALRTTYSNFKNEVAKSAKVRRVLSCTMTSGMFCIACRLNPKSHRGRSITRTRMKTVNQFLKKNQHGDTIWHVERPGNDGQRVAPGHHAGKGQ